MTVDDLPSNLTLQEKRELLALIEEKKRRASRRKLFDYYPEEGPLSRLHYPKQMRFFKMGAKYPERCIMAANRTGKTEGCTLYEATLHMTGLYPVWWEGYRFDRAIKVWFVGTTAETTRDILQRKLLGPLDNLGTGLIPGDCIVGDPKKDSGIPDAVETFTVRHVSGGISRGQFKAYKQGRKGFEGDEVDVVVYDEEPPFDIYGEGVMRTMTTKGLTLLGFTPQEGLTETVLEFLKGGINLEREGRGKGRKFIIGATWDDAPHLDAKTKKEMLEEIPVHLRGAKTKGIPSIGSGAIYPIDEEDILVKDFEIPEHWPRIYGMDVGWKATAALWAAWDRTNDIVYLTGEYKRGQTEPEVHAKAIKSRGEWIPGVIDPASAGSSQKDGTKLLNDYKELGLELYPADNTVESGLFECYKRLTTGRMLVFKSLTQWLEEFRIYRRDKKGKVVKENDHLMDPMRYIINDGLKRAVTRPMVRYRNMSVTKIMDTLPIGTV